MVHSKEETKKTFLILLIFFSLTSFSQISQNIGRPFDIQETTITDSFVMEQIKKLVQEQIESDSLFRKGLGGIRVRIRASSDTEVLYQYSISPDSFQSYIEGINESTFPQFYTYISDRLILIHVDIVKKIMGYRYSKSSKKSLRKKILVFLEKPQKLIAKGENGKIVMKNFRNPYLYSHGSGKEIFIYQNKPPVVRRSNYTD